MKIQDLIEGCKYGEYYCSTDKKWKCRTGPKQSRTTENASSAMASTADRLANKDDGRVAKLRAAGDKRREEQLKGRDIARRDRTSKDAWGDLKFDEARTNPEQNVKLASGMKELHAIAKTISDPENWAISMTAEPKLGINPQVGISEDTPKGIYFYPLNYALDKTRYGKLPWGDNYPYIQLFQYDRSGEMTKETKVDPGRLKQALSQYCSEEVIQQAIDEPEYDGTPYWTIYDCLSRLGKSDETNVVRWNKVLRDLGFTSVYDPGKGWIAYNEPTQGVILDPRVIKQHKTISNRKETSVVTPDKIEQAIFDTLDIELAANRAWQAYDPDGTKLRAAAKEYAKDPKFKPWLGKPGTEEIYDKASSLGRWGARQLGDKAWDWYKEQQTQQPVKQESIDEAHPNSKIYDKCWPGYKKVPGKKRGEPGSCIEETYDGDEFFEAYGELWYNEDEQLDEADYHGRKVPLGKPMQGDVKKFKVYVKDPSTGNVKKVNFGDPDMRIKKSNPARRRSFRARHNCANPGPRTKARYWSCRKW
jgi:hypothetical protein